MGSLAAMFLGMSKTGFTGVSLLGVALMAQIFPPRESTGVILPLLVFADLFAVTIFNRHALWFEVLRILPPAVFGVVIGFLIFQYIPSKHFGTVIGWMILGLVAWHFWRRYQAKRQSRNSQIAGANDKGTVGSRPNARLVSYSYGTLAGATTMIANAAGPVMTVYLLSVGLAKYAFTGTSAWIFCLINLTKLPFSYALGVINRESLWFNAFMLPAVVAGVFIGRTLLHLIPQIWFDRVLLISAALAAVKLILQDPDLFRQQAYVGGLWCDADNAATAEVNNPATGEILGTVPLMGRAETRRAIEAAKHAWTDWRRRPVKERSVLLRKWHDLMLANVEDLGQADDGRARQATGRSQGRGGLCGGIYPL